MKIKINNLTMEFKSYTDIKEFLDNNTISTIETDKDYFFIVFKNRRAVETIKKYFNKSFSFEMNDRYYVYFEGEKENLNIDFVLDISSFDLNEQKTYFNYGTALSYQIVPSETKIDIKDMKLIENGKSGFNGSVRKWKCQNNNLETINEYVNLIDNELLTDKLTLDELKNYAWYLHKGLGITHKTKKKKILENIIETNNLKYDVNDLIKLELNDTMIDFVDNFYRNKLKTEKEIQDFELPKKYTEIQSLLNKNKKLIKMISRNVNVEKIHGSGLFYNLKNNIWIPFLEQEDLKEMLDGLFFCKVANTTYLLYEDNFFTSDNKIWQIILKTISDNFQIELTETYKKEIMNRIEWLANENILEPCYKVNKTAILETGKTQKFDPKKHFPFWMYSKHKKPTEKDYKNAKLLLLQYVKEEKLEKLKTMLRYWFIPTSLGKKMFFIFSANPNTGKTTFIENFAKDFFDINYTPLAKIEENGSSTSMNQIIQLEGEMSNNLYSSAISGKIKKKTGERTLYSKNLFENSKSEFNFSKFISTTNSIPNLKEENALFSKVSVIEFGVENRKIDHTFFDKNWHLVESLRRVILQEVLDNGENVIATLLSKKNDDEDNKILAKSVKIYTYCKRTGTDLKNATYSEFLLWLRDYEGDRVSAPKKYCEIQIEILRQEGIEINPQFFGHKTDLNKKVDVEQFIVKKENKK